MIILASVRRLECESHTCGWPCHPGECPPCRFSVDQACMPRRLAWRFAMGVTGHIGMPGQSYGDVAVTAEMAEGDVQQKAGPLSRRGCLMLRRRSFLQFAVLLAGDNVPMWRGAGGRAPPIKGPASANIVRRPGAHVHQCLRQGSAVQPAGWRYVRGAGSVPNPPFFSCPDSLSSMACPWPRESWFPALGFAARPATNPARIVVFMVPCQQQPPRGLFFVRHRETGASL
jgi:hypothetical protein